MRIAGVDEVGRGPLAGPVTAAAVILDPNRPIKGLVDSKQLSEVRRYALALEIQDKALCYTIASADVDEIDRLNILQASLLAMQRATMALTIQPQLVQVDGKHTPDLPYPVEAIIGGDALVQVISAASIIAKVARDTKMKQLAKLYPGYGFEKHKGYPTAAHQQALRELGACPIHRRSFAPVKQALVDESRTV